MPKHELQHLGGRKARAMVEHYAHIALELDKMKLDYITATFGEKEKGENDVND